MTIGIAALTGLGLGWAGFEMYHQGRIMPGVEAAGVKVGGLTLAEAEGHIAAATQGVAAPQLVLKAADRSVKLAASEFGWQPDPAATAKRAFAVGRGDWGERVAALRGQVQVPLVPSVNADALESRLDALARSWEYAPADAKIGYFQDRFIVKPDKPGLSLDTKAALDTFTKYPDRTELEFFPTSVPAKVAAATLRPIADQANALLRPVKLSYLEPDLAGGGKARSRTLSAREVADLLTLEGGVGLDKAAVGRVVSRVARAFDRLPSDARYVLARDGSLAVRPEVQGWKMNQAQAQKLVEAELLNPNATDVNLPVLAKTPRVLAASLPKVESLQLLAEATTNYGGSALERVANVHAAARNLDGYIVPAGGVFNFNDAIGGISPENGFMEALVISGGRTVKGVGGGVCQVSTTAFRALYQAGLPIVERNQHAYRVRWYDPIVGYDAAVYQPYLNLRAANDTPGPMVVRTAFTNSSLTVRLYGVPDGRQVAVSAPTILSRTPHPAPQYVVERTLRRGQVKQVDWAVDGLRTRITRTVTRPDGTAKTDILSSNFRPWRAIYQVGPGTPIPGGQNIALASR